MRAHFGPVPNPRAAISIDEPRFHWIREHGTLHIPDIRAQNDFRVVGAASGSRTFLIVPLRQQRDLIGALVARCFGDGPRSEVIDLIGPAYSVRQMTDALGRAIGKNLRVLDVPAAAQRDTLIKANVSPQFAEALVEMFACFASGDVSPHGQRIENGATELSEVIARRVAA